MGKEIPIPLCSLFEPPYKLIYHQLWPEQCELYDLGALSDLEPGLSEEDQECLRQLRALGYLESAAAGTPPAPVEAR